MTRRTRIRQGQEGTEPGFAAADGRSRPSPPGSPAVGEGAARLRRVRYVARGCYTGARPVTYVDGTPDGPTPEEHPALFHCWMQVMEAGEAFAVAVLELPDGSVIQVPTQRMRFIDPPDVPGTCVKE